MHCEDKSSRASNSPAAVGWPGDRTDCDCSVQAATASHWSVTCPCSLLPALIGGPYQVAASPLKMCQLESEGAGVSGVRAVRAPAGEKTLQSQW